MTYVFNLYNLRNVCNVSHFHCFGTLSIAASRGSVHTGTDTFSKVSMGTV